MAKTTEEMRKHRKEYNKKYREEHLSECREYNKRWRLKNKEHCKEYNREWNINNKEYRREYIKEYKIKNSQKEYFRNYNNKRARLDNKFRLNKNITTVICFSLKGMKKGRKWESLVGYTLEDLIKHLEKQFEPWMNWENYGSGKGKWNIDHIKPIVSFHYIFPEDEEFKKCWELSNLRPLDAIENIKKKDKILNNY